MLWGATKWLAQKNDTLSFSRLITNTTKIQNIKHIRCDFEDEAFLTIFESQIAKIEQIDYLLIWMHSKFHPKTIQILDLCTGLKINRTLQIFGTSNSPNAISKSKFYEKFHNSHNYGWLELGSNNHKWLSHDEISNGTIQSLQCNLNATLNEKWVPIHF